MKSVKNMKKGYVLMLVTIIIWGMDNVLIKSLLNNEIPAMLLIYLRFVFSTVITTIILKIKKESYSKDITNSDYKKIVVAMATTLSLFYILQVNGLSMTKAVISEFVGTTMTTLSTIVILSIFIKSERRQMLNKFTILALIIAVIGTFFTALGDISFGFDYGVLLIIFADIFWGLYTMLYMKIDNNISALRVNRDLGIIAIVVYTVMILVTNQFVSIFNLGIFNIIKIGLISTIIDVGTVLTYYVAIRIISGVKCSILSLASPIISFTLSYFYLGERIVFMQFIGCILLFASSILLVLRDLKRNKQVLEVNNGNL